MNGSPTSIARSPVPVTIPAGMDLTQLGNAARLTLQTGALIAGGGAILGIGLIGYSLYAFGQGRSERAMAAIGGSALSFWLTKKFISKVVQAARTPAT